MGAKSKKSAHTVGFRNIRISPKKKAEAKKINMVKIKRRREINENKVNQSFI